MKTKEEQLKIYAAYLPYGLELQIEEEIETEYTMFLGEMDSIMPGKSKLAGITKETSYMPECLLFTRSDGEPDGYTQLKNVKPILYDLSWLTKEIEHEGERFVPMIKLLEYLETNHFSKNEVIKNSTIFDHSKIIDYETKTYDSLTKVTEHKVRYLVETSNMGTLVYSFAFDESLDRFLMRDDTQRRPLGVGHQRQLFEKLFEWHLNIFGIPAGEFIDKGTLKTKSND